MGTIFGDRFVYVDVLCSVTGCFYVLYEMHTPRDQLKDSAKTEGSSSPSALTAGKAIQPQ